MTAAERLRWRSNIARRKFIAALGGAALAWPFAARAQQTERVRRIGVLMLYPENDPAGQVRAAAFRQGLERLGWTIGRDLQIDFHWGTGDAGWMRGAVAGSDHAGPGLDPRQWLGGNSTRSAGDPHASRHFHRRRRSGGRRLRAEPSPRQNLRLLRHESTHATYRPEWLPDCHRLQTRKPFFERHGA